VVLKMLELLSKGNSILDQLSFPQMQTSLVKLLQTILANTEYSISDKNIVANALTLWKCCLFF
jgi:hypothetical protein